MGKGGVCRGKRSRFGHAGRHASDSARERVSTRSFHDRVEPIDNQFEASLMLVDRDRPCTARDEKVPQRGCALIGNKFPILDGRATQAR